VLAGIYAIAGHSITAARLLSAVLGALGAGLVAALAWELLPRLGFALLAGLLAALLPSLVALSGSLLSESLFIVLTLAITMLLLRVDRRRAGIRIGFELGVLCGAATLTRTAGLLLLAVALVAALRTPSGGRSFAAKRAAAVVTGALVVLAPWAIRDSLVLHAFVPLTTQSGYTLATTYNGQNLAADLPSDRDPNTLPQFAGLVFRRGVSEVSIDTRERSAALRIIVQHPLFVAHATEAHFRSQFYLARSGALDRLADAELGAPSWLTEMLSPSTLILTALAIAGVALTAPRRWRVTPWPIYAVPALVLISTIPLAGSPRYRIAADPFLCIAVAAAVYKVGFRLRAIGA
jgi:4-amino-4-deoxy-L-arabinose transferase-like glycosyltransferase